MIEIKEANIAKSGRHHSVTIPIAYIKNALVDPDKKYNVILTELSDDEQCLKKDDKSKGKIQK